MNFKIIGKEKNGNLITILATSLDEKKILLKFSYVEGDEPSLRFLQRVFNKMYKDLLKQLDIRKYEAKIGDII